MRCPDKNWQGQSQCQNAAHGGADLSRHVFSFLSPAPPVVNSAVRGGPGEAVYLGHTAALFGFSGARAPESCNPKKHQALIPEKFRKVPPRELLSREATTSKKTGER